MKWVNPILEFGIWISTHPEPDGRHSDRGSLRRQRSVFTEDAGSIVPVDQPPRHCADLIKGIEFLGGYSTT
jgi:hypothetical protein